MLEYGRSIAQRSGLKWLFARGIMGRPAGFGMGNEVLNVGLFRRKVHDLSGPVMKARVYLAAEGYVDLYVNGENKEMRYSNQLIRIFTRGFYM